jgi:cyanophycinase
MTHGVLLPIGGAEDKTAKRIVLSRFVALCGGNTARIAVIAAASAVPEESGKRYVEVFSALGAAQVTVIPIASRTDADSKSALEQLRVATGVFFTGGDQLKLVGLVGGTRLHAALRECHAAGMTVGGTSAGASALSQHMIAFGKSGGAPQQRMVQLTAGLGLCAPLIIDQHFRQRDRIGRLLAALALNPQLIGAGIDENTALLITSDGKAEVIGSGSVTIVDGSALSYTDAHAVKGYGVIALHNVRLHILTNGQTYDLNTRLPASS